MGLASEPMFKTGLEFGEEFLDGGLLEREDGEDIVGVPSEVQGKLCDCDGSSGFNVLMFSFSQRVVCRSFFYGISAPWVE